MVHEETLERYQFIFDRTTVGGIPERYAEWHGQLDELTSPNLAKA